MKTQNRPRAQESNAQRRMRKQLLEAGARLLKKDHAPSMDDVAQEAMVSRATVYRYFPTIDALLAEAPVDEAVQGADEFFEADPSRDPVARLDRAEAMLHAVCYRNQGPLRAMLAASLQRSIGPRESGVPIRQNRRTGLIEAAVAPARGSLTDTAYSRLRAALSLVFGTESMVVFTDILGIGEKEARHIKKWMIAALVDAALRDSEGKV